MLKLSIGISIGTLMADGDKSFPLIAVNTHSILNNFGIVQMGPDFSPVLRQIIITHAYCRVSSVLTIVNFGPAGFSGFSSSCTCAHK
jgi:hypothetical protein